MHPHFYKPSIFVIGNAWKNIVTLQQLARHLDGEIYVYPINVKTPEATFYYDFKSSLQKHISWEAVFRIRVTSGWRFMTSYANYVVKQNDLLCYQADQESTISYDLTIDNSTIHTDRFNIQTALLYTTGKGQRRLRVHNYQIACSKDLK